MQFLQESQPSSQYVLPQPQERQLKAKSRLKSGEFLRNSRVKNAQKLTILSNQDENEIPCAFNQSQVYEQHLLLSTEEDELDEDEEEEEEVTV